MTPAHKPGSAISPVEARGISDIREVVIEGKLWQAADNGMQIFAAGKFEPETVCERQVTDDVVDELRRHILNALGKKDTAV
jgi:hypothetical protein